MCKWTMLYPERYELELGKQRTVIVERVEIPEIPYADISLSYKEGLELSNAEFSSREGEVDCYGDISSLFKISHTIDDVPGLPEKFKQAASRLITMLEQSQEGTLL